MLVDALSRALADRVIVQDITLGRKGFLGYLKSLGGSNIVKIVPHSGSASESQAATKKGLKVICGANTSYLADSDWISANTPPTICEVRVCAKNSVKPNIGALELAEALERVLPFASNEDTRPVLRCILFVAKEGKLTLVSADGFRLATVSLDYDDGEGQALIDRDDLKGISSALRRARRARIGFESNATLDTQDLLLDTELIRYKWLSVSGTYPEWQKLIPSEFKTFAHLDTVEAARAIGSLKALSNGVSFAVDLNIGGGRIVLANPDDKGRADIPADTDGEAIRIRLQGDYLAQALKACGGMVDMKLTNGYSPVLFSTDGYQVVTMPMTTPEASEQAEREKAVKATQATARAETAPEARAEQSQAVAEAEAIVKAKAKVRKHGKAKVPVAV